MQTAVNTQTVAYQTAVSQTARNFAAALVKTPQFQAFEQASQTLQQDSQSQQIINDYQQKQQSLYMMSMLNAVSAEDQAEITRLQEAIRASETITAYTQCQTVLIELCQEIGSRLSKHIGLDFAAACGASCCG